jgi:hypothetical protein
VHRPRMESISRGVVAAFAFAFGVYFVRTSPYWGASLWLVWAPLLVGSTTAAGLAFNYGLNRWAELVSYKGLRVRVGDVAARIAVILAVIVGSLVVVKIVLSSSGLSWRHVALICVLLLGSVPPAGVMGGIRHVAGHQPRPGTRSEWATQLVRLRDLLQRLLAAVGSVVALSTLAIGASIRLQQTLAARSGHPVGKGLPPQFVLIFGGLGSVLVALFYVPAATALRRRGQCLCDELLPPPSETDDAAAILSAADNRQKLGQLLGADRNIIADLQAGLAILGPLLASAAAAFLSP